MRENTLSGFATAMAFAKTAALAENLAVADLIAAHKAKGRPNTPVPMVTRLRPLVSPEVAQHNAEIDRKKQEKSTRKLARSTT